MAASLTTGAKRSAAVVVVLSLALVISGCSAANDISVAADRALPDPSEQFVESGTVDSGTDDPGGIASNSLQGSALDAPPGSGSEPEPEVGVPAAVPNVPINRGRSLAQATEEAENEAAAARPVRIRMGAIDIDAPITDVGVELDGELEIPGATEVGWYQFGSRPGETGNAVLAAHVDYNGELGAFFELREGAVGDIVEIDVEDGETLTFVVRQRAQYRKDELPFDEIFRRDGAAGVVLITCGGDFNPSVRSYEDNVVLFAELVTGR